MDLAICKTTGDLRKKFADYSFRKLDITKECLEDNYSLIFMIDVTQHIVDEKAFSFAMQNINNHLTEGCVFIVTSWMSDEVRRKKVLRGRKAY